MHLTPSQQYEVFGDSTTFPIDAATGAVRPGTQSLVKGDWARPVPWVVTLGQPMRFSNTGNPVNPPRGIYFDHGALFAIVEWGFGGTNFAAEVDWRNGCAFGVTGTYCRVTAIMASDLVVAPDASGGGVTVAAAATPEAVCARPSAYRTVEYTSPLGSGDEQARYIPAYADEYMVRARAVVIDGVATPPTWRATFVRSPGAIQTVSDIVAASGNRNVADSALWLPVDYSSNMLNIENTHATEDLVNLRAVYRLGLG